MIQVTLQRLSPKLKGGKVHFSVLDSIQVETDRLPVVGRGFRYWEKGDRKETGRVKTIDSSLQSGYCRTYEFTTAAAFWRITITDPIFHGT